MCVKFRPAWADKGVNIQAGGLCLASCPSSQEPWSLICRGTKESGDERKPTPPHSAQGKRGGDRALLHQPLGPPFYSALEKQDSFSAASSPDQTCGTGHLAEAESYQGLRVHLIVPVRHCPSHAV